MLEHLTLIQLATLAVTLPASVLVLLEARVIGRRRLRRAAAYDWSAVWTTARMQGWRWVVTTIPMGAVLGAALPLGDWMHAHRLWTVSMASVWAWVALFLCSEFCYYWMHRAGHRVRWYWASHQAHHSSNQFNLAASFRQSLTDKVSGGLVFFAPLCWLGFSPDAVLGAWLFNLVYQFGLHTELIGKLGWLEGVINTPSAHRVHHAANVEYLDCNYGGTVLLFDRLFGTYVAEEEGVPIRYGLVKPQTSRSALRICLAPWWGMWMDLRKVRGPRDLLGYLFGAPGWTPDGQGLTTAELREHMMALTGQPAGVPPEWLLDGRLPPEEDNGPETVFSASPFPMR